MKKFCKQFLAIFLSVVMLVSMLPASVFAIEYAEEDGDYYKVISKKDWELAPGVSESEIVLNNDAGTHRQVAHVVEVDIHNEYTKVLPSYKGMIPTPGNYGVQTMDKQVEFAEANGYGNVVAAMNLSLSWYDSDYYKSHPELVGEPLGYMILDGVQYTNSNGVTSGAQTCVVINFDEKDGVARPADIPKTQIRSTADAITGWEEQVIPANFGFLVKDGKNQYGVDNNAANGASRSFVGIKADGTFVMVMNDGRQAPYSTGFTNYEMAEFMLSLGCVQAVNGDGGGSSQFLSQRPGEEMKINCAPSDGALRDTTHGILVISTAPATGEFVRANISSEYDYYTPGSVVEFEAIGTDLVGTAADIPAEAIWQLADESFGTIENGVFTSTGKEGEVTVQMVYNGNVVGEDTIYIVMPDKISFAQENMVVPFGKTVKIVLDASYDSKTVLIKADDVEFALSDNTLGTLNGFDFTAVPEGTEVEPGTITATVGELSVTANLSLGKGSDIVYDFENQDITGWTIYTNYGKYGPNGPNGKVTDDDGNYWYHGQNERGYISVVDSTTGKVRNGDYALAVECDFSQPYETGYHALNLIFPTIDTTDAIKVGFWLYVPYDARHAQLGIAGGGIDNGELSVLCEGWHYVTAVPRTDNTFYYINISVDDRACAATGSYYDYINEPNLNGRYTFYIDDITVDYSTAVEDRENPVFEDPTVLSYTGDTSAVIAGQDVTYNTPTFEVKVADFAADNATGLDASTAKAYIDGKEVECTFTNGKMTILGNVLSDGVHTIKFEISDNAGNSSWVSGNVNIVTGTESSTVKVVPQDPSADRLPVGSVYWLDVVASDIETIDKVEMVFDLNNASYWEFEGITAQYGFTVSSTLQADDNIATIIIERTDKNDESGEAVIASIPVRAWESHITEYEGYESQTPATLVKRGIIWAQSIEVALERGIITYVDSYTDATIGTFGMENILVDTELFFTNYSRKSVTGAQEWINAKVAAGEGFHEHTVTTLEDKAATCTEYGYTGRTYCEVCASVVEWGTITPATGHNYSFVDGTLKCACGKLYNGVYEDGKTYVDGLVIADGWVDDTYYYLDGFKLTGPQFIDGVMYTFNDEGVYQEGAIFEGFYETRDGKTMYFLNNKYITGLHVLNNRYCIFGNDGYAWDGVKNLCGYDCTFEDGLFVEDETVLFAGTCGKNGKDNVVYVMLKDGRMIFDGEGETEDYLSVGTIPWYAWELRAKMTSVYIGKGITTIGTRLLYNLDHVTKVVFERGSKLQKIKAFGMGMMVNLKTVDLPEGLQFLYGDSFKDNTALTSVTIPKSVSSIAATAFNGADNVTFKVLEGTYAHTFATNNNIETIIPVVDDVNDDAKINLKDLVTIAQYMADWDNLSINSLALDMNGDGKVNLEDVNVFARRLAGWDV